MICSAALDIHATSQHSAASRMKREIGAFRKQIRLSRAVEKVTMSGIRYVGNQQICRASARDRSERRYLDRFEPVTNVVHQHDIRITHLGQRGTVTTEAKCVWSVQKQQDIKAIMERQTYFLIISDIRNTTVIDAAPTGDHAAVIGPVPISKGLIKKNQIFTRLAREKRTASLAM
ncbi:hypothetical protein L210DRAFT_3507748 [Boletus edulis BED1]|uniref:Uncharacterized protein n=1 Tax=Boletus edulis BED1 TaxID=1328754 RepID=A0AAD4BIZ1_BOLED|nr:hypothetical protein L210DRAFT_3507748 [Boletus edulis BED1]